MGAASFLIGVLPTYETIGIAAPVLLVLFRVVQGIAIDGEWAGATLMVVEHADARRRGLWSGVMQMGSPLGFLLSTLAVTATTLLPPDQLLAWGRRIPALISTFMLTYATSVGYATSDVMAGLLFTDFVLRRKPESSREQHGTPDGAAQKGAGR
ncbi:MFS family permease [Streptomyces sp. V4I23]|nr:MFS family permease [Streptomyces sp. V4I23]